MPRKKKTEVTFKQIFAGCIKIQADTRAGRSTGGFLGGCRHTNTISPTDQWWGAARGDLEHHSPQINQQFPCRINDMNSQWYLILILKASMNSGSVYAGGREPRAGAPSCLRPSRKLSHSPWPRSSWVQKAEINSFFLSLSSFPSLPPRQMHTNLPKFWCHAHGSSSCSAAPNSSSDFYGFLPN